MKTCYNSRAWVLIMGLLFMGPFSVPVYAEEQLIEFATLAKAFTIPPSTGDYSIDVLIQNGGRYNAVITNTADLEEFWHAANIFSPLPEVDFTQQMVIAVLRLAGTASCHDTSITKLVEAEETLTVHIRDILCRNGFALITMPFHIIETARTDKEILFTVSETVIK